MKLSLFVGALFFALFTVNSQTNDTLFLLNGDKIECNYKLTENVFDEELSKDVAYKVHYEVLKGKKSKIKSKKIAHYKLLSIQDGSELIQCYQQDTSAEDDFTFEQMERYVKGRKYGKDHKTTKSTVFSGVVGAGSGYLGLFWGCVPVTVELGAELNFMDTDTTEMIVDDKELLKDDFFVNGYKRAVRDKKLKNGAISGWTSMIVSAIVLNYIYTKE